MSKPRESRKPNINWLDDPWLSINIKLSCVVLHMIIKIPFKTPTINHLYWHRGNIKIMKKEAKELREEIKEIVNKTKIEVTEFSDFKDKPLKVVVTIYEDWYCLNGTVKRKDIANREKFLIDSVFDALGIDDKFIFENTIIKHQDEEHEFATINITSL